MRPAINISDAIAPDRILRLLAGVMAILFVCALSASSAKAEFTHKYIGQITLASGTDPQPIGVDPEGNIIVFLEGQEVIAKFSPSGNPVNFSALGTNVIDGAGGLECPIIPSDCDRVPAGQFGPFFLPSNTNDANPVAAVDESGGPANGYIYVRNHNKENLTGEIDVFAPTGKFLGTIDESQATPISDPTVPANSITVAPNGAIYVHRENQNPLGTVPGGGQVDEYAPIDGNPAHDEFVGQLRFAFQYPVAEVNFPPKAVIGAGLDGAFVRCCASTGVNGNPLGAWRWYAPNSFQNPEERYSDASDYLPFDKDNDNYSYSFGYANPHNNWIYLIGGGSGIAIYGTDRHHKIGPTIATDGELGSNANTIAFDNSGGPNDGRFYVKGGEDKLAIFGPPVVIPDINVGPAEAGHHSAVVHAEVGLAGGPKVTECIVEYGLTTGYGSEVPCTPSPEYSEDTQVSAELTGLFTEADYHYRVKAANANGWNHTFDNVLHTVAVLGLHTDEVTNLAATTATLNGSLNPDGMETTYRFQYGLDKNYDLETSTQSAGSGSGEISVDPVDVQKLQPGRTYHYRIVGENELGTTFGQDRTFTAPATPLISSLNPTNVLATSVDLNARINDFNSAAEYFFEYGPGGDYGRSTPVQTLPADPAGQPISVHLEGLREGITYHFRIVATNQYGTSRSGDSTFSFSPPFCPNSHVRQQVGANYLPDCRAYELVSPPRAGSIQLLPGDFFHRLQPSFLTTETFAPRYENTGYETNPARFGFFGALGGLPGVESPDFLFDRYLATRTDHGWVTHYAGLKGYETGVSLKGQCSITQSKCLDYKVGFFIGTGVVKDPFPYVWDANGNFLGRWPTNYRVVPGADHLTGDEQPSPDFSHFVFSSLDVPFKPGGLESAPGSVYDNAVGPGTVEIASKLDGGEAIPQDAGGSEEYIRIPAISTDGSHILMSTQAAGGRVHLYMRVNDAVTYEIAGGNGVELLGMSADGSKVAFLSPSALTPEDTDSSTDIYLWEEATQEVHLISQGGGAGNSDSCHANWTERCNVALVETERPDIDDKMSANGDVYFYSPEQLDPNNPGVYNQRNLYHVHNGHIQYVTTLDPGSTINRMQISANGDHAAFVTNSQLTGYDNRYYDNFGNLRRAREMYVFDANTGEVQCASCNPTGEPPSVLRLDPPANESGTMSADVMASDSGRFMSDDGRVAFATAEALSPRDTDGIVDVYEYTEGRPQLISGGNGDRDIVPKLAILYPGQVIGLESMSRDGTDLYFSTFETLVPQDENGPFVKFYDARTGGGFPVPGKLLPCEAADECHGETSLPPANPEVGTGMPYTSPGAARPHRGSGRSRRRHHSQRRGHRHARKHRRHGRRANG